MSEATVTIKMNSELLEMIVLGFLYGNSLIPDKHLAYGVDLGLDVGEDGLVELDVLYTKEPQQWDYNDDVVFYDEDEDVLYVEESPFEVVDES